MRAVVITESGGPDVLAVKEVEEPTPGPGEVVMEVHATALNRADLMQREGRYPPPAGAPPYPGLESAGRILRIGPNVEGWNEGDRVMALLGGGGYAEHVRLPQETLMPIPPSLSYAEAAAIPEAWLTAYSNMLQIGRLQPSERVLIHAGGSGVGSAAIQLAKWRDATVFTTISAGKMDSVLELGADVAINYHEENFADRIAEETNGEGVNLIIDFIGAPYWDDNIRALALWGRLVLVGLMGGAETKVNLRHFMGKKLTVSGSTLRDRTIEQKGQLVADFTREVLPTFEDGLLYPVLDERQFQLHEIAAAHRYMEDNRNFGKIIVLTNPE